MWLFVNNFGFIDWISGLFLVLFVSLLLLFCCFIVFILMYLFEKTCLLKLFKDIVHLILIINYICIMCFLFNISSNVLIKNNVALIPQYGTQSQKEMLAICIQDKRPNGLTEEDKKDVAYVIQDIMLDCQRKYDTLEQKHKQELEHRKFLLKNKEILDSLDKILIEQGAK